MEEQELRETIAKNIVRLRKLNNLTQLEFAEKLNYSDKSISKWERGESTPDVVVLNQICSLFGVSIDDLMKEKKVSRASKLINKYKSFVPFLSAGLVWLIATVIFVFFNMFDVEASNVWLAFIYAIPVSSIVLLIFSMIWGRQIYSYILFTVIIWTLALSIYLSVYINNSYLFFIIPIPFQLLLSLWYIMKKPIKIKNK